MGMIAEFQAGISVFHEGRALVDSTLWKNRQTAGNHVTLLLIAATGVARGFGYDFNIDHDTLQTVGMGIAALVAVANSVLTTITSTKVGIKPRLKPE